eukprot:Rhum_TRINITY_DN16510_c0_g1::Rhum_TRINITY_DN16510_c0_g1_i1::g.163491::m.163491/K20168/TBC1D15; TBC1 domain family member 15
MVRTLDEDPAVAHNEGTEEVLRINLDVCDACTPAGEAEAVPPATPATDTVPDAAEGVDEDPEATEAEPRLSTSTSTAAAPGASDSDEADSSAWDVISNADAPLGPDGKPYDAAARCSMGAYDVVRRLYDESSDPSNLVVFKSKVVLRSQIEATSVRGLLLVMQRASSASPSIYVLPYTAIPKEGLSLLSGDVLPDLSYLTEEQKQHQSMFASVFDQSDVLHAAFSSRMAKLTCHSPETSCTWSMGLRLPSVQAAGHFRRWVAPQQNTDPSLWNQDDWKRYLYTPQIKPTLLQSMQHGLFGMQKGLTGMFAPRTGRSPPLEPSSPGVPSLPACAVPRGAPLVPADLKTLLHSTNELRRQVFARGCTAAARLPCWEALLEADAVDEDLASLLEVFQYRLDADDAWVSAQEKAIEKDVLRTKVPAARAEHEEEWFSTLRQILQAYMMTKRGRTAGYIQGMNDVAAVACVVQPRSVSAAFAIFASLMLRLGTNFDDHAIAGRALVSSLLSVLNPRLHEHLACHDSDGMCTFRWLFLAFKRELSADDLLLFWDTVIAAPSAHYTAFASLALLDALSEQLLALDNLPLLLRFCQNLRGHVSADSILAHTALLWQRVHETGTSDPVMSQLKLLLDEAPAPALLPHLNKELQDPCLEDGF